MDVEKIREVVEYMKERSIPPGRVESEEEARELNERYRLLGIEHEWKVGDRYYTRFIAL